MTGLTDYITGSNWVDIFAMWYILVDDAFQQLITCLGRPLHQSVPEPAFTDSKVITVALIIVTFFAGHEDLGIALVKQYHSLIVPRFQPAPILARMITKQSWNSSTEAL
jgi:hypothetical protein